MLPKMEPLIPEAPSDTQYYIDNDINIHTSVHTILNLSNLSETHHVSIPDGAGNHPVF